MAEIEIECCACPRRPSIAGPRAFALLVAVLGASTLGVSIANLAQTDGVCELPETPCERMGGRCRPRLEAGVDECRTVEHVRAKRAVTWVQRNPKLPWHSLVCPEHLHCCLEDPCETVLRGECTSTCEGEGKATYSGFCPAPKWQASDTCCA